MKMDLKFVGMNLTCMVALVLETPPNIRSNDR